MTPEQNRRHQENVSHDALYATIKGWCWYFMQAIFSWMNRTCFCICNCALICKYAVEIPWFHPLFTLIHWCTDSPRWSLELHMEPEFSGLQQAAWPLAETRSCGLTDCCKWLYSGRLGQPTGKEKQSFAYNHLESSRLMFFFRLFPGLMYTQAPSCNTSLCPSCWNQVNWNAGLGHQLYRPFVVHPSIGLHHGAFSTGAANAVLHGSAYDLSHYCRDTQSSLQSTSQFHVWLFPPTFSRVQPYAVPLILHRRTSCYGDVLPRHAHIHGHLFGVLIFPEVPVQTDSIPSDAWQKTLPIRWYQLCNFLFYSSFNDARRWIWLDIPIIYRNVIYKIWVAKYLYVVSYLLVILFLARLTYWQKFPCTQGSVYQCLKILICPTYQNFSSFKSQDGLCMISKKNYLKSTCPSDSLYALISTVFTISITSNFNAKFCLEAARLNNEIIIVF